jgi:hypothetical protein
MGRGFHGPIIPQHGSHNLSVKSGAGF